MKTLIVVDMQNDFITGPLGTPEARAIVPNVTEKVEEYRKRGDYICYTRDTHFDYYLNSREGKKLPVKHCIRGTTGWQIPDELLPPANYDSYDIHDKYTFGSIRLPDVVYRMLLEDGIFDLDEIELVGVCADVCLISNALLFKASFYDICEITVDASCCAGTTPENHKATLQVMKSCQINVIGE